MDHAQALVSADFRQDPALDNTWRLLRDGYEFIGKRCQELDADYFVTRLLGKRVVCLRGEEAARLFYDEARFERRRAVPRRVVTSLFGKGGVQGLDAEEHRRRKALFLSILSASAVQDLASITRAHFQRAISGWQARGRVILFDASAEVLTRAVCQWAGVPLLDEEAPNRAADFVNMVDAFGGVGPRLWRGKIARARTERWIQGVIRDVRAGRGSPGPSSAVRVMAGASELSPKVAAVELINLLRPTVAIAWYVAFAAHALWQRPHCLERLRSDPDAFEPGHYADWFVQEVRRYYPFTPFVGARVKSPFDWRGHHFEQGQLVLLDVYGAQHHERHWDEPRKFNPERFAGFTGTAFNFIPQGGGTALGHRCAGEWVTLAVMGVATGVLARDVTYEVAPGQAAEIPLSRMPTRPRDGLVITNIALRPHFPAQSRE
jgi:fatty-acid peroxygenase